MKQAMDVEGLSELRQTLTGNVAPTLPPITTEPADPAPDAAPAPAGPPYVPGAPVIARAPAGAVDRPRVEHAADEVGDADDRGTEEEAAGSVRRREDEQDHGSHD